MGLALPVTQLAFDQFSVLRGRIMREQIFARVSNLYWRLSLRSKLLILGLGSVVIITLVMMALIANQSAGFNHLAQEEVNLQVGADLDHITQGVYELIKATDQMAKKQVSSDLNMALLLIENMGRVRVAEKLISWEAVDLFSSKTVAIELPKLFFGGHWLMQNPDPKIETPLVDEVQRLVGGSATVYQRVNDQGDMLGIATNILRQDGNRAIGTLIPAFLPDGQPNPIVEAVLQGETYHGLQNFENTLYMTAFEPIYAENEQLVGMLCVGQKLDDLIEDMRQAIMQVKIGETGYVYILGGQGDDRGHYIISKDGARDGENIINAQDGDGRAFIQDILNTAIFLPPGKFATERYPWQNADESQPRWQVARVAYYQPWDWVIGASAYEDEFSQAAVRLDQGRTRMLVVFGVGLILLITVVGALITIFANGIARPVRRLAEAAHQLSRGEFGEQIRYQGQDEIGELVIAFGNMISYQTEIARYAQEMGNGDLSTTVQPRSERDIFGNAFGHLQERLHSILLQVQDNAGRVENAAGEMRFAANQAGQATSQIAATVQQVAKGTSQQSESVYIDR